LHQLWTKNPKANFFVLIFFFLIPQEKRPLTCSWHQKMKTNSPIHQFKVLHKGQRAFKTPFSWCIISYFLL
jgi:hypothetical protein